MGKVDNILIEEIRLNRKSIEALSTKVHELDKDIFSNKMKLSIFISGVSLFSSILWAILFGEIKHYFV